MTTDAVHRRFKPKKESTACETEDNQLSENTISIDHYFCKQCDLQVNISPNNRDLKHHFETKAHDPYGNCVYCNKPVYEYVSKNGIEIYHTCKYD